MSGFSVLCIFRTVYTVQDPVVRFIQWICSRNVSVSAENDLRFYAKSICECPFLWTAPATGFCQFVVIIISFYKGVTVA